MLEGRVQVCAVTLSRARGGGRGPGGGGGGAYYTLIKPFILKSWWGFSGPVGMTLPSFVSSCAFTGRLFTV